MIVLAGHLAATRPPRPDWADSGVPDGELVTMSGCLADLRPPRPGHWTPWSDEPPVDVRPPHHALAVGLPDDYLAALRADSPEQLPPLPDTPLPDWEPLGYELVGADTGVWHTWLCLGGLVDDVGAATGVRPGRRGLIEDEHDARCAADWLTASNLGDPKVFLWLPVLLLEP